MATAASPTPMGSGNHSTTAPTRKTSLRSGLRNAPSTRPTMSRAESNPVPTTAHASRSQRYAPAATSAHDNDSSDDEIPVPMKLSALTKALLNDGGPDQEQNHHHQQQQQQQYSRVRTRAQSHKLSSSPAQQQEQQQQAPVQVQPKPAKRRSALNTSMASIGEERRHTRASSAQVSSRAASPIRSQASRDSSPVRKRVVRLSASSGAAAGTASASFSSSASASQYNSSKPAKRRSTSSLSASQRGNRPPSRDGAISAAAEERANASDIRDNNSNNRDRSNDSGVNTPAQQGRVVRIAVGSSGNRGRSTGSSAVSSYKSDSASHSHRSSHASLSQAQPDVVDNNNDVPEDAPQTVARERAVAANLGSVSRLASSRAGVRPEDNPALQGSMRVRRVSKVPGSFLSGPARRGRRRQSEEEEAENEAAAAAGEQPGSGTQDQDAQQSMPPPPHRDLIDLEPADNMASSYYAPDRLSSGSPVSGNSAARAAAHKRASSMAADRERERERDRDRDRERERDRHHRDRAADRGSKQPSPDRDEIPIPHYRIPPPRSDLPSRHDQENEAPPTFKRSKAPGSALLLDKEDIHVRVPRALGTEARGESAAAAAAAAEGGSVLRPSSPPADRKVLSSLNQNTPRRSAPAPPPKMSILDTATAAAGAATTTQATAAGGARRRNYMRVNGKCYTRLDSLGRGGSGKVYRVAADNGKMFALKRVSVEGADEATVRGYKGEIDLLRKLNGVERVINLFDYEMNEDKQVLSLLMEMGEMDLNTLLRLRLSHENARFDPVFVRFYWQEMLECLAAVHAHDIVHSDLKPANFVLVQGRLKLIDFGIANAIQTDQTVNVHRETQIGTPNYMSPESLIDFNSAADYNQHRMHHPAGGGARPKLMKLGKPSDIWSLGCILYQMVYGVPPFGHIANQMARCHAIINWNYAVEFPDRGVGGAPVPPSLLRTMRRCLARDQHLRPTCAELLAPSDPFLYPVEFQPRDGKDVSAADAPQVLPITEELLGRIVQSVVTRCRERMPSDAEALSVWPQAYWGSVAKAVGRDVAAPARPPSTSAGGGARSSSGD